MFTSVLTGLEELGFAAALLLLDSWWQSLALMGGEWLALRLWRGVNAATRGSEGYPQISLSCEIWDSKPLTENTSTRPWVDVKINAGLCT